METKEVSRNFESTKEEVMGSFSFQTGTLCGLQPLLFPSGESALQQESPTRHIPNQVTQDSTFNKLDTHLRFGVSAWHYASSGRDKTNFVLWFKPWETGPRSEADEEFSWTTGYLPWSSVDEKFREESRAQLQEVVDLIREITEAGGQVPTIKEVLDLANQRLASRPSKKSPRPSLHSRRRLVFDSRTAPEESVLGAARCQSGWNTGPGVRETLSSNPDLDIR